MAGTKAHYEFRSTCEFAVAALLKFEHKLEVCGYRQVLTALPLGKKLRVLKGYQIIDDLSTPVQWAVLIRPIVTFLMKVTPLQVTQSWKILTCLLRVYRSRKLKYRPRSS
jgi:hypothetical protein